MRVLELLLVLFLASAATAGTARIPDPGFFSPQLSPDGAHVLWESLDRGGSIWLTNEHGDDARFLVRGHSPSWNGDDTIHFVVSTDDGHRVLSQDLYAYDLDTGATKLLSTDSGNPAYETTLTGEWEGVATAPRPGPLTGKTVCVDPGHGANSGAASTISGKKEDHYVLIMSYLARDYLDLAGANVRMTRFDNSILPGLQERVNFSNSCAADAFSAVHLNSASNAAARGLELYYRSKDTVSQRQARHQHDAMVSATGIPTRGVRADKETLGYTLAVLSENHRTHNKTLSESCFLTNADDVKMLEQTRCLDQWAWGIYAGLSRQLGSEPMPLTTTVPQASIQSFGARSRSSWIGGETTPIALETPEGDGSAAAVKHAGAPFTALRQGGAIWADYRVTATLAALDGTPQYGLVARSNKCAREGDLLEGYLLVVDEVAGTAALKLSLGKPAEATVLATAVLPTPPAGSTRVWRALALECRGALLKGTVDGVELTWTPGEGVPVLVEGKYGVLVQSGAPARVALDRLALESLQR